MAPASMPRIVVLGRFPPPIDGQSLATKRLVWLLQDVARIEEINLSPNASGFIQSSVKLRSGRIRHYVRQRRTIADALRETGEAVVLWGAVSPSALGHFRDYATVLPGFRPEHRVFGIVHWGNFDRLFRRLLTRRTALQLLKRIDGLIFLDERLSNRCSAWIPSNKRLVIPNTIDPEVLFTRNELHEKWTRKERRSDIRLLFLSNMTPSKGYMDVLKAVALLKDRFPGLTADFVGRWESDHDQTEFGQYVRSEGLAERVRHHGGVSDRGRIKQFYADADVFLLPTYYPTEAQPVTVIEALNSATPVVTTRHAGLPWMLDESVEGTFVQPRDPESIARGVGSLIAGDTWIDVSRAARARFERQFHPDHVRALWLDLIGVSSPSEGL
jgi:glycosyltransferase involved in cell wall biosynthesis